MQIPTPFSTANHSVCLRAMHASGVSPLSSCRALAPTRVAQKQRAALWHRSAALSVRSGWLDNFGKSTDAKKDEEYRRQQVGHPACPLPPFVRGPRSVNCPFKYLRASRLARPLLRCRFPGLVGRTVGVY